jgi:lipopolysaccharide transport system ATP-binding protein
LLIVSHDRGAIQSICDRALLLDGGRLAYQGTPEQVMDYYNALIAEREGASSTIDQTVTADGRTQTTSGSREAVVSAIALEDEHGAPLEMANVGAAVTLRIRVQVHADLPRLVLGYMIKDRLGQPMFGTNTHHMRQALEQVRAGEQLEFRFSFPLNLGPGSYSVTTALTSSETHLANNYEWRDLAFLFIVMNMNRNEFVGSSWLEPAVQVLR